MYDRIWSCNKEPKQNEFVLITNGPYHYEGPEDEGRGENKEELIKKGERFRTKAYSLVRVYNDQKKIVWDGFLPTTMELNEEDYDPEYFREITSKQ